MKWFVVMRFGSRVSTPVAVRATRDEACDVMAAIAKKFTGVNYAPDTAMFVEEVDEEQL